MPGQAKDIAEVGITGPKWREIKTAVFNIAEVGITGPKWRKIKVSVIRKTLNI
jgi:hypothetical protein